MAGPGEACRTISQSQGAPLLQLVPTSVRHSAGRTGAVPDCGAGGILTVTVMAVNLGVAWGAGSVRWVFNLGGKIDHPATGVLGLVFIGLALRMLYQEARVR